jgi:hypothetical protein
MTPRKRVVVFMGGVSIPAVIALATVTGGGAPVGQRTAGISAAQVASIRLAAFTSSFTAPPAFYVSPSGNDSWPGTSAYPFATLQRAQAAMEAGSVRTTVLEGGTYVLQSTFLLGPADSGEEYVAAQKQVPVIEGSSTVSTLVSLQGASGITFKYLTFADSGSGGVGVFLSGANGNMIVANHFTANGTALVLAAASSKNLVSGNAFLKSAQSAVELKDGSNSNLLDSNLVNGTGALDTAGGAFYLHGVNDNTISHNQIENTVGMGIGVLNWDDTTINIGNTVTENILLNTDTGSTDSGAIYVLGRSQMNTQMLISNNFVSKSGSPVEHSVGIYLDDSTSGATVAGNILCHMGSDSIQIHGGSDNTIRNNILDLGTGSPSGVLFQAAPANTNPSNAQVNNVVTQNIFFSASASPKIFFWIDGGAPDISGNLYYNTAGASMATVPPTQDTDPFFGNPLFTSPATGNYALQPGSAAALIGFAGIDQANMGLHPTTPSWY